MPGKQWICAICKYQQTSATAMERSFGHDMSATSFFFCWFCKFVVLNRVDMWAHLQMNHSKELPKDFNKDHLVRSMYRPDASTKK